MGGGRGGVGVDYDEVLDHVGQLGHFQRKIFLWLALASAAAGLGVVAFAFTGGAALNKRVLQIKEYRMGWG